MTERESKGVREEKNLDGAFEFPLNSAYITGNIENDSRLELVQCVCFQLSLSA